MFVPLGWSFSLAVSLHNLEETLGFPHYAQHFRPWHIRPFRFALVVLTALAFIMAFLSQAGGERSVGAYLHAGYMLAMLLNVFVPHITVSLMQRRLMPGTLTALFFILPITLTGLINGLRSGWLEPHPFALYGIGVTAALLASIPLLFRLGAALCRETLKG